MELSDLNLSEEQLAGVTEFAAGLKRKNNELLGEKKAEQQKVVDANEAIELARKAAQDAEEQRLLASGKTDELKAHYEKQLAEGNAKASQLAKKATDALMMRDKGDVINQVLTDIDPRYHQFVKTQLQNSVTVTYGEDGKPVTSITDGDAQYTSSTDFLNGVKESETWQHVLKATSLSGAGAQQSGTGTHSKKYSDMSFAERAKFNSQ
jgi:hypothetical protein